MSDPETIEYLKEQLENSVNEKRTLSQKLSAAEVFLIGLFLHHFLLKFARIDKSGSAWKVLQRTSLTAAIFNESSAFFQRIQLSLGEKGAFIEKRWYQSHQMATKEHATVFQHR